MSQSKLIMTGLIPFMVFIGCGQSFKAYSAKLREAEQTVDASNLDVPGGKTPKSRDQEILNNYMSEFNSLNSQSIENIISDIRSFEVQVDREENRVNSVSARMHTRTHSVDSQGTSITACNNLIEVRDSQITLSRLKLQNSVFLGRRSDYEFIIQCTDPRCDEMVVAIRRLGNNQGLVLMGLKSEAPTNHSGNSYTQRYVSRSVDIETYFTVAVSPDEYISVVCSLDEQPTEDVDPTGGLFDTYPTGGNTPIDPTGDNPANTGENNQNDNSFWYDRGDLF